MASKAKLKYSDQEISILQEVFKRSKLTITRWIEKNDDRLTSKKAIDALEAAKNSQPLIFEKDKVYRIDGKKQVCILLDE